WHKSNARAHSPANSLYMGDDTKESYAVGARVETTATTRAFWLPASVVSMLSFRLWLETEGFNQSVAYDVLYVDLVREDGSVVTLWNSSDAVNGSTAGSFRHVNIDLGDFADETVQLRWRFDSGDEYFNDFEGAYIDDIAIKTACCNVASDCDDADDCTIDSCQGDRCNYIHTCDACAPTPVNMLVLLDFSSSMNEQAHAGTSLSKWQAATNSLVQVMSTYGAVLNTALKLFKTPGPAPCTVSTSGLELPFHSSSQAFANYLPSLVPGGLTPTSAGLYGAQAAYADAGYAGTKYVLLITDGSETCGGDPVKAVEDLYAAGLDVYVVGFGEPGDGGIDHDLLNDMAEAGGHGRNIETAAEAAYFHATSSQELTQV
ncbi:MAG: VWA domain-containing protein, partial [Myxococcota bacterium]|nr:VWA domain-containing protein [Myxococcota bacterium]